LRQRKGLKNPWAGEEDVFLVHPQNGLILNWCTGGCWFTPAQQTGCTKPSFPEAGAESQVRMKTAYRKKEDI
jgi:hypothetical protein